MDLPTCNQWLGWLGLALLCGNKDVVPADIRLNIKQLVSTDTKLNERGNGLQGTLWKSWNTVWVSGEVELWHYLCLLVQWTITVQLVYLSLSDSQFLCCTYVCTICVVYYIAWGYAVLGHIQMTVMCHTNVPHSANVLGQACLTMSCIDILSGD